MKRNKEQIIVRKVHIISLMDMLAELFDRGVDFIDLKGINDANQDTIMVSFCKEYMNQEYIDNYEILTNEQFPAKMDTKLSDEDLNQLI